MITICPDRISLFGQPDERSFCLLIPIKLKEHIQVASSKNYINTFIQIFNPELSLTENLKSADLSCADIIFIPYEIFDNVQIKPKVLPAQRVLRFMCSKTAGDLEDIDNFFDLLYKTDPDKNRRKADAFFETLAGAQKILLKNDTCNTQATLALNKDSLFTKVYGDVRLGTSSAFPCSEIALTHRDFLHPEIQVLEEFNGKLVLQGMPILHRNTISLLSESEQNRLFNSLLCLLEHPVIATLENGQIMQLEPTDDQAFPAIQTLEALFQVDSRLRKITEIGFGLDSHLHFYDRNTVLNEGYGGENICAHIGIGGHQTIIHLDIVVPGTRAFVTKGSDLLYSLI